MKTILLFLPFLAFSLVVKSQSPANIKIGTASYYHSRFEGRKTATGDKFSNKHFTAASNHYKLGTRLKVTNLSNNQSVIVLVNDRMAKSNPRVIDLAQCAARQLCFIENGLCRVKVEIADESDITKDEDSVELNVADSSEALIKPE